MVTRSFDIRHLRQWTAFDIKFIVTIGMMPTKSRILVTSNKLFYSYVSFILGKSCSFVRFDRVEVSLTANSIIRFEMSSFSNVVWKSVGFDGICHRIDILKKIALPGVPLTNISRFLRMLLMSCCIDLGLVKSHVEAVAAGGGGVLITARVEGMVLSWFRLAIRSLFNRFGSKLWFMFCFQLVEADMKIACRLWNPLRERNVSFF